MTMTATVVQPILRSVAAWGLAGAPTAPEAAIRSLDEVQGRALVTGAADQRVVGLLATMARTGAAPFPDEVTEQALEAHRSALVWCLRLEVELLELHALLARAGIVPLVLKGPAAAHLDAADPSLRTFADLDLLVSGDDLPRAIAVIEATGARRMWAERRPRFDQRFTKSVTLRGPDGVEIDLHRSLCDGVHGFRIPLGDLHRDAAQVSIGGRPIGCLSRTHRVLHTAYHLALGSPVPRLMSQRDLAEHLTDPSLSVETVSAAARAWRGEAVLAAAIRSTVAELQVPLPAWERWAAALAVAPREVRIVEQQRREGSGIGRGKLDALVELPGWRDRAAYGWALVAPSRAHLHSRGRSRLDPVRGR